MADDEIPEPPQAPPMLLRTHNVNCDDAFMANKTQEQQEHILSAMSGFTTIIAILSVIHLQNDEMKDRLDDYMNSIIADLRHNNEWTQEMVENIRHFYVDDILYQGILTYISRQMTEDGLN